MEKLEVNNLIIVESKNDKYFIEAFVHKLNLENIILKNPICNIDNYECLSGIDHLNERLNEIRFDKYKKLGIILDADNVGIGERIEFINKSFKSLCPEIAITEINKPYRCKKLDIEIIYYIMNVEGKGELETVLKVIKSEQSIYADCLNSWRECLNENGENISDKVFDKFWVNNYLKFDTCSKNDKKQRDRKCNNEVAFKKNIWNFEHEALKDLKQFLQLFD